MSKPRDEVQDKSYGRDIHFLYEIIHSLNSTDEFKLFLKDILTKSELRMLKRRWHIANLLSQGLALRTVAAKSQTSTQTVSRIKHILLDGKGGLSLALKRTKTSDSKKKQPKRKRQSSKYVKDWFLQ